VPAADVRLELAADMRYLGQGSEVTVAVPLEAIADHDPAALARAFADTYRARFDRTLDGMPVEVVSWRLRALSPAVVERVELTRPDAARVDAAPTTRPAYFAEAGGYVPTPVVQRTSLGPGAQLTGPVLIEEAESTIVVGPSGSVRVDDEGNLLMTITHTT
jgi:N-methylhydantoinase A